MKQALIGFRWNIFSIVFPRLCVVGLNVAQPFLINEAIRFVQSTDGKDNVNIGYGLIGAYAFVYVGTAVCTSSSCLSATEQSVDYDWLVSASQLQTDGNGAR